MVALRGTRRKARPVAALVLALAAGPATSARAWEPVGLLVDAARLASLDAISYRALERADFRAPEPPPEMAQHASQLGAVTCAYLVPAAPLRVSAHPVTGADGAPRYRGELAPLSFRAVVDRGCSWWREAPLPADYVLEHEQVHFALTELEARRLNARARRLAARFRAEADTPDEVVAAARVYVETTMRASMQRLLDRNARFDRETSLRHRPEVQARWRARVERELEATRPHAASDGPR